MMLEEKCQQHFGTWWDPWISRRWWSRAGGSGNLEVFAGIHDMEWASCDEDFGKGSENWGIEILWKHLLVFKRAEKRREAYQQPFLPLLSLRKQSMRLSLKKGCHGRMKADTSWAGSEGLDCERGCESPPAEMWESFPCGPWKSSS